MTAQPSGALEPGWDVLGAVSINDPQAAAAAGRVIPQAAEQVTSLLAVQPDALDRVLDIVRRALAAGIGSDTYGLLFSDLSNYLGSDVATLLAWLAGTQGDAAEQQARLAALDEHAMAVSPEAPAFFRAVVGSYGSQIDLAWTRSNELPHNWNVLSREVVYDVIEEKYRIRVTVEKFNGEKVVIEGPPDAILNLATGLIVTARLVNTRSAFSDERIATFIEKTDDLLSLLKPEAGAQSPGGNRQGKAG